MAAPALAPGGEPKKQRMPIIRDEAELQASKCRLETEIWRELQASTAASNGALQGIISLVQAEITKVGSLLQELKSNNVACERVPRCFRPRTSLFQSRRFTDEVISLMLEVNAKRRQLRQFASEEFTVKCSQLSTDGHNVSDNDETAVLELEGMLTDLADKLNSMEAEMHALEEEYQKDLLGHKKLCEEGADVRAKRALIEPVMEDIEVVAGGRGYTLLLHLVPCVYTLMLSLTRHAHTAEMEKVHNSVAEELQVRVPWSGTNVFELEKTH